MKLQRAVNNEIVQYINPITRGLAMLVNGFDFGSTTIGPRDLLNPFEFPLASAGAITKGSNTFGGGVDFSISDAWEHPHTKMNPTPPYSVMCLLTSGGANWTRVLHFNVADSGFMIINRGAASTNIGIWAGTASTWGNGRMTTIADGVDAVIVATISASYVPINVMVNGVLGSIESTGVGNGSSQPHISWGQRTDGLSGYDGVSNMFAIWNRELSLTEMYSLTADPWQMSREPFPLSAMAAAASSAAAPAPTGRRRIIVCA